MSQPNNFWAFVVLCRGGKAPLHFWYNFCVNDFVVCFAQNHLVIRVFQLRVNMYHFVILKNVSYISLHVSFCLSYLELPSYFSIIKVGIC